MTRLNTPIPDLYQVKWFQGSWRYGIVDRWSDASIQYYEDGQQVIVDDATTLDRYVLNVDCLTAIPSTWNPLDEYHTHIESERARAQALSDSLPPGAQKGKLFRVPAGDGYAYYVITKVNKKTVDIEWRGYSADRWVDFRFGAGGRENRETIERLVAANAGLQQLFAAQPAPI